MNRAKIKKLEAVYVVTFDLSASKREALSSELRSAYPTRGEAQESIDGGERSLRPPDYHIIKFIRAGRK